MSQPLRPPKTYGPDDPGDPAYFLLERGLKDPSKRSTTTVYDPKCYICRDPEFSLMGMSLCFPCPVCGGHIPADGGECDNGHNAREHYEAQLEASGDPRLTPPSDIWED